MSRYDAVAGDDGAAAKASAVPSRNGSVTAGCQVCGGLLPPGRARRTCSDRCRQALWRRRHQSERTPPPPLPQPGLARKAVTVYECPACGERMLGEQRCECGSFMRRVGVGGTCPACEAAVAFDELLSC